MRHILISFLLILALLSPQGMTQKTDQTPFMAVIVSRNLKWMLYENPQYKFDFVAAPQTWDEIPKILQKIKSQAGDRPILLDFFVHGNEQGLHLVEVTGNIFLGVIEYHDRATFGWVLGTVERELSGSRIALLFESCFSGRAYKKTIRGAGFYSPYDNVGDYLVVPGFPIYGAGDSFSCVGPIMYLQWQYQFQKYWVDLRDYDPLGKDRKLLPIEKDIVTIDGEEYSATTLDIKKIWDFFREEIP